MNRSLARIQQQAQSLDLFDEIILLNERKLAISFRNEFASKLRFGSRGFGYWCWKPQVILQVLEKMKCDDILLYTDVGCHLNPKGRDRLAEYISIAQKSKTGLLAFQARPPTSPMKYDNRPLPDLSEHKWTKGDAFDYFRVRHRSDITRSQSIGSGVFLIRKCRASEQLIKTWRQVVSDDFSLFDDTPSQSDNFDGFIEHRHDQSCFSVLCKLNNVETVSAYEYWYPRKTAFRPDWQALDQYPIHARRDKDIGSLTRSYYNVKRYTMWFIRRLTR